MAARRRKVALDHNLPQELLEVLGRFIREVEFLPIYQLDPDLAELEDHELVYELARRRWTIMVTGNYKMLADPAVLVALHQTRLTVFSIEKVGDDPILAAGALLRDLLPAIRKLSRRGQVFRSRPRTPDPERAYELLVDVAQRQGRDPEDLLADHRRPWRDLQP